MPPTASTPSRLLFLDWLRIGAFALLVLYHVGMYYVSWGWHVKSPFAGTALEPWMRLSSPWRLSLLFLISGAATSFMLQRDGASALAARLAQPAAAVAAAVRHGGDRAAAVVLRGRAAARLRGQRPRLHAAVRHRLRRLLQRRRLVPDPADLEPPVVRGLPVRLHAGAVAAAARVAACARAHRASAEPRAARRRVPVAADRRAGAVADHLDRSFSGHPRAGRRLVPARHLSRRVRRRRGVGARCGRLAALRRAALAGAGAGRGRLGRDGRPVERRVCRPRR